MNSFYLPRIILFLSVIIIQVNTYSQDKVILKSGRVLKCKILSEDSISVKVIIHKLGEDDFNTEVKKIYIEKLMYNGVDLEAQNKKAQKDMYKHEFTFHENTFFEFGGGGTYLVSKDVYSELGWGVAGALRYKIELFNHKIGISPSGNFRLYSANLKEEPNWSDKLWIFNGGIQLSYTMYSNDDNLKFLSFVEISNSWVDNFFSCNSNTNKPNEINLDNAPDISIFQGSSLSGKLGLRLHYSIIYFELSYDLLNAKVELSDELKKFFQEKHIYYNSSFELPMNAVNFCFGFSLNPH